MGEERCGNIDYYVIMDGQPVRIEPELAEVISAPDAGISDVYYDDLFSVNTLSVKVKLPKNMRCGSRKRFVKLLMSRGAKRDVAAAVAEHVRRMNTWDVPEFCRISYQCYFLELLFAGMLERRFLYTGEKKR